MDSTRRAVFDTNELMEKTMSYLPSRELFILQRVSKQWRGVIAGSPVLQEKMFLRSQSATSKEIWLVNGYNDGTFARSGSSYLRHVARAGVPEFRRADGDKTAKKRIYIPTTLNSELRISNCARSPDSGFLLPTASLVLPTPPLADMTAIERVFLGYTDVVSICIRPTAFRRNCSLLNTYLSDPPCRVAEGLSHTGQ